LIRERFVSLLVRGGAIWREWEQQRSGGYRGEDLACGTRGCSDQAFRRRIDDRIESRGADARRWMISPTSVGMLVQISRMADLRLPRCCTFTSHTTRL
jgi:hypothetical protein